MWENQKQFAYRAIDKWNLRVRKRFPKNEIKFTLATKARSEY